MSGDSCLFLLLTCSIFLVTQADNTVTETRRTDFFFFLTIMFPDRKSIQTFSPQSVLAALLQVKEVPSVLSLEIKILVCFLKVLIGITTLFT